MYYKNVMHNNVMYFINVIHNNVMYFINVIHNNVMYFINVIHNNVMYFINVIHNNIMYYNTKKNSIYIICTLLIAITFIIINVIGNFAFICTMQTRNSITVIIEHPFFPNCIGRKNFQIDSK